MNARPRPPRLAAAAAVLLGLALVRLVAHPGLAQEPPFPTPPPTEPFPTVPSDVPSPAPRTPTYTPTVPTPTASPSATSTGTLQTPTGSPSRTATATPGEATPTSLPAAALVPYGAKHSGLGPTLPTIQPSLAGRNAPRSGRR